MTTSGRTHNQDTGDTLCGICESQHITKCAGQWCPECEEGLCFECQKHHSLSKSTRTHGIISIENYKKLQKYISEIAHNCRDSHIPHSVSPVSWLCVLPEVVMTTYKIKDHIFCKIITHYHFAHNNDYF
jgi:hypothetical protein